MENYTNSQKESIQEQEIDLIELFYKLLSRWKWFIASFILALAAAYIYIRLVIPVYQANATIVIKDTESQNQVVEKLFEMANTQLAANSGTQIEDEMEILRSRSTIQQVVNELRLHTVYSVKEGLSYMEKMVLPIVATLDKIAIDTLSAPLTILLEKENKKFQVTAMQKGESFTSSYSDFPITMETSAGKLQLYLTNTNVECPDKVKIIISRPVDVVKQCSAQLTVGTSSKKTSIISLSYKDIDKRRAELFLSKLIEIYNRDAMEDKNKITGNSLQFIEERLDSISRELGFVEKNLEHYKLKERLSDIKTNMMLDLNTNNEYEKKLLDVETQLNMTDYITEYLVKEQHQFSLLPINTGVSDNELTKLINEYNKELLERERLSHMMKEDNPTIINQNLKVDALRRNVISSVSGVQNSLRIARNDIMQKTDYFNSRIGNLPKQEREFNNIDRQQQIKANLYLMLLERREQAAISLAATINKARVVDEALASDVPITPRKMMIYGGAGFIAFILTTGIVLFGGIFRTKVASITEIDSIHLPIVGAIPEMGNEKQEVSECRNELIDEAFRRLRSNLRFIVDEEDNKKCILITSTLSGEGKSFISINLALTMAFLGRKVLLIGLDLRRPRLGDYFGIKSKQGITSYLSGDEVMLKDIIFATNMHNQLFVVPAGPIPPNPAELLEREKLKEAFVYFREHFDYIIVDSAPVGMVSDTLCLSKVTDFTLYVCRLNNTPKKSLPAIQKLEIDGHLNKISILVNGCNLSDDKYSMGKYGYHYGYGYGYGHSSTK